VRKPIRLQRIGQTLALLVMTMAVFLVVRSWQGEDKVYALPEYSPGTGEPCGVCHVSPGGGGPRTLRGLLWSAYGRPDEVPQLPGGSLTPDVDDGAEIYDLACAACHGSQGQGLFGMEITGTGISRAATRSYILRGIPGTGMPAFEGQFSDTQLEALIDFVSGLASGEIQPLPQNYPLSPGQMTCSRSSWPEGCVGGTE
jgi:cytochrome c5